MNKQQLIAEFGGTEAEMARQLGMSPQRVNLWGDTLNKQQQDGVIAALVRKSRGHGFKMPDWMLTALYE